MQFSQALLALAVASATMAAPVIDSRDVTVNARAAEPRAGTTVIGSVTNILSTLQTAVATAQSALTAAAKTTTNSVQIIVQYANILNGLKSAASSITGTIPTTTAALKTQISGLSQAELAQLTSTITTLQATISGLGSSITTSAKGLQGVTSSFATGEIASLQSQLQSLTAPIVAYAQNVQKYASTGLDTSALSAATKSLQTAVTGQVNLIGLSNSSSSSNPISMLTPANVSSFIAELIASLQPSMTSTSPLPTVPKTPTA